MYRGFPQTQWKLFIAQQRSLLPDARKSPAPPTLLTAGLQNTQTDTASLDRQSPVNLAWRMQTSPAARSLSPVCPAFWISCYFWKQKQGEVNTEYGLCLGGIGRKSSIGNIY